MKKPIFTIKNPCAYPGAAKPVLEIANFEVYKKELVFFECFRSWKKYTDRVPRVMNKTIVPDKDATVLYHNNGSSESLFDLWTGDESKLSNSAPRNTVSSSRAATSSKRLRCRPTPSCLHLLFRESRRFELRAHKLARAILQNVSVEDYNKKNAGYQWGQKQRLAFIQAMVSQHEVLFGDEPTGNLDWGNEKGHANTKDHISENNKTGLVVSHDVNLSVAFADRIVLMTGKPNPEMPSKKTGQILEENIFEKSEHGWTSSNQKLTDEEMIGMLKGHFVEQA